MENEVCLHCLFGRVTSKGEKPYKLNDEFKDCPYCNGIGLRVDTENRLSHWDLMSKWFHLSEEVLSFYDSVNKEPTRNRRLYLKHLKKIIEAVRKDLIK